MNAEPSPDRTELQVGGPTVSSSTVLGLPTVPGFEVLKELGRGGMGVVYQARQLGLNRTVAMKMVLHGEYATERALLRFRAEAEAIAKLRHPHIVEVYAYGEVTGLPYFALEYCEGGTLAEAAAGGPMPLRDAVGIVTHLTRAVQFAHQAGIIHRDLKPGNVLLTRDGVPKVTDFGLAKTVGDNPGQTTAGELIGTPAYMAPEQATGKNAEVGVATDVYALGAILYALLTGRSPFPGDSVLQTLDLIRQAQPVPPRTVRRDVPRELQAVVLRCLEKEPKDRYPSCAAMADDLDRWLAGARVLAYSSNPLYRTKKWAAKNRTPLLRGAAVLGVTGVAWAAAADRGYPVPGGAALRGTIDRYELSLQRPTPSVRAIRDAAHDHRVELARLAIPSGGGNAGWVSGHMNRDRGFVTPDVWTQVQATACLVGTPEVTNDALRPVVAVLATGLFEPNPHVRPFTPKFGWSHWEGFADDQPSTEGCAWGLTAIARAVGRPGLCGPDERATLLRRLDQIQETLDLCYVEEAGVGTGGWKLVAQTSGPPAGGNPFTTTLVFQGLIELAHAGLPWRGSAVRRDALLSETHAALAKQFTGKGWVTRGQTAADLNDGLTLQLFSLFLRAEEYGLRPVPTNILGRIPAYLSECEGRPGDHPVNTAVFDISAVGLSGKPLLIQRPVRFLWHPWAIECASRWLVKQKRTGVPHEEIVRTRRVLGRLVGELYPQMKGEVLSGYTFVAMETMLGLTACEGLE